MKRWVLCTPKGIKSDHPFGPYLLALEGLGGPLSPDEFNELDEYVVLIPSKDLVDIPTDDLVTTMFELQRELREQVQEED